MTKQRKLILFSLIAVFVAAALVLSAMLLPTKVRADDTGAASTIPPLGKIVKEFCIGDKGIVDGYGNPIDVGAYAVNGDAAHFGYYTRTVNSEGMETYRYSNLSAGWQAAMNSSSDADARIRVKLMCDWVADQTDGVIVSTWSDINGQPLYTSFGTTSTAFGGKQTFLNGRLYIPAGTYVQFDLNGYVVDRNMSEIGYAGQIIYGDNCQLEIIDSEPTRVHQDAEGNDLYVYEDADGNPIAINGGIFTGVKTCLYEDHGNPTDENSALAGIINIGTNAKATTLFGLSMHGGTFFNNTFWADMYSPGGTVRFGVVVGILSQSNIGFCDVNGVNFYANSFSDPESTKNYDYSSIVGIAVMSYGMSLNAVRVSNCDVQYNTMAAFVRAEGTSSQVSNVNVAHNVVRANVINFRSGEQTSHVDLKYVNIHHNEFVAPTSDVSERNLVLTLEYLEGEIDNVSITNNVATYTQRFSSNSIGTIRWVKCDNVITDSFTNFTMASNEYYFTAPTSTDLYGNPIYKVVEASQSLCEFAFGSWDMEVEFVFDNVKIEQPTFRFGGSVVGYSGRGTSWNQNYLLYVRYIFNTWKMTNVEIAAEDMGAMCLESYDAGKVFFESGRISGNSPMGALNLNGVEFIMNDQSADNSQAVIENSSVRLVDRVQDFSGYNNYGASAVTIDWDDHNESKFVMNGGKIVNCGLENEAREQYLFIGVSSNNNISLPFGTLQIEAAPEVENGYYLGTQVSVKNAQINATTKIWFSAEVSEDGRYINSLCKLEKSTVWVYHEEGDYFTTKLTYKGQERTYWLGDVADFVTGNSDPIGAFLNDISRTDPTATGSYPVRLYKQSDLMMSTYTPATVISTMNSYTIYRLALQKNTSYSLYYLVYQLNPRCYSADVYEPISKGVIYVGSYGTLELNGGEICDNNDTSVIFNCGETILNGTSIHDNISIDGTIRNFGTVTLSDGELTDNCSVYNSGGIVNCDKEYFYSTSRYTTSEPYNCVDKCYINHYPQINVGGSAVVKDNYVLSETGAEGETATTSFLEKDFYKGDEKNIVLKSNSATFNVTSEFENAEIHLSLEDVQGNSVASDFRLYDYTQYNNVSGDVGGYEYSYGTVPSDYFIFDVPATDTRKLVLHADGYGMILNAADAPVFKADYAATPTASVVDGYGTTYTYEAGQKVAVAFTNGSGDLVVTAKYKGDDFDLTTNDIVNAGVYEFTYEPESYLKFTYVVVINPKPLDDDDIDVTLSKTEYIFAQGVENCPDVTVKYDGSEITSDGFSTCKIQYANNVYVGTARVTVTLGGNYSGSKVVPFTIKLADSAYYEVVWQMFDDGNWKDVENVNVPAQTPYQPGEQSDASNRIRAKLIPSGDALGAQAKYAYAAGVTDYRATLEATDISAYVITFNGGEASKLEDVGSYTAALSGGGAEPSVGSAATSYGVVITQHEIERDLSAILAGTEEYVYDGTAKQPAIRVYYQSLELTLGKDYTVSYTDSVNADKAILGGEATAIATLMGNYFGINAEVKFTIKPVENHWQDTPYLVRWAYGEYSHTQSVIIAQPELLEANATVHASILNSQCEEISAVLTNIALVKITDETYGECYSVEDPAIIAALSQLPASQYVARVWVAAGRSYTAISTDISFNVAQAETRWTVSPSIIPWVYGQYDAQVNMPIAESSFGTVIITITDEQNNVYYDSANGIDRLASLDAAAYVMTARVEESQNYTEKYSAVAFNVSVIANSWIKSPSIIPWETGKFDVTLNMPKAEAAHGTVEIVITDVSGATEYYNSVTGVNKLAGLEVGMYRMTATVPASTNYSGLVVPSTFTVNAAENHWQTSPTIIPWETGKFDPEVNIPFAEGEFGDAIIIVTNKAGDKIYYSNVDNINELASLPAGDYDIKVDVLGDANYAGLSVVTGFTVLKASNYWDEAPNIVSWQLGHFDPEKNMPTAKAAYGEARFVVISLDTNETVYDSTEEGADLSKLKVGSYMLMSIIDETSDYGTVPTPPILFEVFKRPGMPWWSTLSIAMGALLIVALVLLILFKKGIIKLWTTKTILAMRQKQNVDNVIATVRMTKYLEERARIKAEAEAAAAAEEAQRAEAMESLSNITLDEDEEVDKDDADDDKVEMEVVGGVRIRFNRSFTARVIQGSDELKQRYSDIKNLLLSFNGVKCRISWKRETFRIGRKTIAKLAVRGKTLCLYLAADPAMFAGTKYRVTDISEKNAQTPVLYRIKNARRAAYVKDIIEMTFASMNVERGTESNENFVMPYLSTEDLIESGMIRRTETTATFPPKK